MVQSSVWTANAIMDPQVLSALHRGGGTAVMLIPSRTDTKAFHEWILPYAEIRFIKGRVKFGGSKDNAPFASMIVIYKER